MASIKRDKNDILFSKIVRKRDNYTCQRCKKKHEANSQGLHCSHYFGRSNKSVRHDLRNGDSLCYGCHRLWGGDLREEYAQFKLEQLGVEEYQKLKDKKNTIIKYNREKEQIYDGLKEIARKYGL